MVWMLYSYQSALLWLSSLIEPEKDSMYERIDFFTVTLDWLTEYTLHNSPQNTVNLILPKLDMNHSGIKYIDGTAVLLMKGNE